jgi:hypothetical protein
VDCNLWTTLQPDRSKLEEAEMGKLLKIKSNQGRALVKIYLGTDNEQPHVPFLSFVLEVSEEL